MNAVAEVPVQLVGYLDELVRQLSEVVELDAVYLFGSAARVRTTTAGATLT